MTEEVEVVRLAARGDGVTSDKTFLPGAVPGDWVRDGQIIPGPNRAEPVCRHFPVCGGCQLQHASDNILKEFAKGRIAAALASAGVEAENIGETHLSPPKSRRRASLRAQTIGGDLILGFNEESSRRVVDMHECHVLTPELFALAQALRQPLSQLLPPNWVTSCTITASESGFDVLLSNLELTPKLTAIMTKWAAAHGVAQISVEGGGGTDIAVRHAAPLQRLGGVDVEMPPGAFMQATKDGEAALVSAVRAFVAGADDVADLFCGIGTFALPLSEERRMFAADAAGSAVAALGAAAGQAGRPVSTEHRDLFRRPLTKKELARFGAVVLDPPRAGAKSQCEMLAGSRVPVIAYVSCNPSTFARDAALLVGGGYRLAEVRPVGQFRWSTHVELAARFVR